MFLATASLAYTVSVYVGVIAAIYMAVRYYFDHGYPFYVDRRCAAPLHVLDEPTTRAGVQPASAC